MKRVLRAKKVIPERRAQPARQDPKALRVFRERREIQVLPVLPDRKDPKVTKGIKVNKASKVFKANKVKRVKQERRVRRGHKAKKVQPVRRVRRGKRAKRGRRVLRASKVSPARTALISRQRFVTICLPHLPPQSLRYIPLPHRGAVRNLPIRQEALKTSILLIAPNSVTAHSYIQMFRFPAPMRRQRPLTMKRRRQEVRLISLRIKFLSP